VPQLAGLIVAGALAVGVLRARGLGALGLALLVVGVGALLVLVPVRGHTIEQWAPLTVLFLIARRHARFRAQRAQVGHVVTLSSGDLDPQPVDEPASAPSELRDVELLECELSRYDGALLGVAKDRRARTYTAAVRVQ